MTKQLKLYILMLALFTGAVSAQPITTPPDGNNQRAEVIQYMGAVRVHVVYNSPDVTGPKGENRSGDIWGKVVPYGMHNLYLGLSSDENPSPWRAGANESTTIEISHDVLVQGKKLKAGKYGLYMIPEADEWTIIFSNNSHSWGAYYYTPEEDALRVKTAPKKHTYTEWLTYSFTDRQINKSVLELQWDDLSVPISIEVPDIVQVYIDDIRCELQGKAGFTWEGWQQGAMFCVNNETNLEQGLAWADMAISGPYVGKENYTTLITKAAVLRKMERLEEAEEVLWKAVKHETADAFEIHKLGRQLIQYGDIELAMEVFEYNYKNEKKGWPTNVGMARGLSALGEYEKAAKYAAKGAANSPDPKNKANMEKAVELLLNGQDIN